jgi:hypothetical protein
VGTAGLQEHGVIMKYFTRGWSVGEFDDEEAERIRNSYWQHIRELTPRLPSAVAQLANDISLHDGVIEQARWNSQVKRLTLRLVCGDTRGLFDVELIYSEAAIGREEILKQCARDRETTILYDEIDVDDADGNYIHRMLFHPMGEISIWFRGLSVKVAARQDWRVRLQPYFIEEEM